MKRHDIAAVGRSGWLDKPTERGFWVTLTAPGADVLPWDEAQCHHSAGVACAGDLGCVIDAAALAIWHDDIGARWNHFVTDLRRHLDVDVQYLKTWETQRRGALHAHAMMRAPTVSARRFQAAVRMLAGRHGFGKQQRCDNVNLSDIMAVARTAGYCAKYSSKNADALPLIDRLDPFTGELRRGGIRSWSASRRWGDTMRVVEQKRVSWALAAAGGGSDSDPPGGAAALDPYCDRYATAAISVPAVVVL